MKLKDRVIVVTGGGSGIGRALVGGLLERGARVAAADLRAESLKELTRAFPQAGDRLSTHAMDVSDSGTAPTLLAAVLAAHGQVDGLINNAGIIQPFVKINDLSVEKIRRVFEVNFFGTLQLIKAFLPRLLERPEAYLVNVSSMGGFLPVPGQSAYCASKAAVKMLSEGLRGECVGTSVRVSVVLPGAVNTSIMVNSDVTLHPSATAASATPMTAAPKAAQIILDGMERDQFYILVGSDSKLMYLLTRLAPHFAMRLIQKQMGKLLGKS